MEIQAAIELYQEAQEKGATFDFASFGFDFPFSEIERRLAAAAHRKAGRSATTAQFLARKAA